MNISAANRSMMRKLIVVAVLMFGFGFALVPFYEKICEVTGINNLWQPDQPANTQVDRSRLITVEFDANIRSELAWRFFPEKNKVQIHPGQLVTVMYDVQNSAGRTIVGQAVPSYSPQRAGQYFKKLDCFCFKQQRFAAGELRKMPVVFLIDPHIPSDIHTVTLSYSFFEVPGTASEAK